MTCLMRGKSYAHIFRRYLRCHSYFSSISVGKQRKQISHIFKYLQNGYIVNFLHTSNLLTDKPTSLESLIQYEKVSEETLQSITERFEEILENSKLEDWDVNYSNAVLKVSLNKYGTYVLNKQTPNRQIWLSSPVSGPKRYDYTNGTWIYKHDGVSLHQLLSDELSNLLQEETDFKICNFDS